MFFSNYSKQYKPYSKYGKYSNINQPPPPGLGAKYTGNNTADIRILEGNKNIILIKGNNDKQVKNTELKEKVNEMYEEHYFKNETNINFVKMVDDIVGY